MRAAVLVLGAAGGARGRSRSWGGALPLVFGQATALAPRSSSCRLRGRRARAGRGAPWGRQRDILLAACTIAYYVVRVGTTGDGDLDAPVRRDRRWSAVAAPPSARSWACFRRVVASAAPAC